MYAHEPAPTGRPGVCFWGGARCRGVRSRRAQFISSPLSPPPTHGSSPPPSTLQIKDDRADRLCAGVGAEHVLLRASSSCFLLHRLFAHRCTPIASLLCVSSVGGPRQGRVVFHRAERMMVSHLFVSWSAVCAHGFERQARANRIYKRREKSKEKRGRGAFQAPATQCARRRRRASISGSNKQQAPRGCARSQHQH